MEKLILIDGNSLLNRAYYATPPFTTKDGVPSNAIFGFIKFILKIASDKKPEYMAVAFDLHAPTFRHKMYDAYKAGRKPMPDDLAVQITAVKDVLRTMNIRIVEKEGFEADDLIGTLAKKFPVQTFIYTGDRDSFQLVDETTSVCYTKRGVSDLLELTPNNFKDETGLETPSQIVDLKSLMGDKSDNIPGVAGVGEKSALSLLEKYRSLNGVYENLDKITGSLHEKLKTKEEDARFSYTLATIDVNVPIGLSLSDCLFKMPFGSEAKRKLTEFEFKSILAMDIFDADETDEKSVAVELPVIRVEETVDNALFALKNAENDVIACDFSNMNFSFALKKNDGYEEYCFPIKENLFDVGYFSADLIPVYKQIFNGYKKVLVYGYKELRHKLKGFDVEFTAKFEDALLVKYIAEGVGNADELEYLLDYFGYKKDCPASGVYKIFDRFYSTLNDDEKKLYEEVEKPLSNVLFAMEEQGVYVDEKILVDLSERYKKELDSLTEEIYLCAGETFNINSTQQLGKILFDKLRIDSGKVEKTKGKKNYSTTAEILEKYAEDHEIVRKILRYRQIQKLNSTYVEGIKPLIKNGVVHTTYNQANTTTGRLSSANPNLQNIPIRTDEGRILRKLFVASKGNVLIDADYSQIELRLLAHFSGCKELREAYNEKKDIHALTASQVFGVPLEKVTDQMRRSAKAVNFGIIYGISPYGLAKDLDISAAKAKEYIDKYFSTYSSVKSYMENNVKEATEKGFITTLLKRKRVINELKSSNYNVRSFGERAAMNMPLQGSSADIIKLAMIGVYNQLQKRNLNAKLVLQVHDELVIDCPESEKDEVVSVLKEQMENAVALTVPLSVEVGTGYSWFDAH